MSLNKKIKQLTQKTKDLCCGYTRSNLSIHLFSRIPIILLFICGLYYQLNDIWICLNSQAYDLSDDQKTMTRNGYQYSKYYRIFGNNLINTYKENNIIARWTIQVNQNSAFNPQQFGFFMGIIHQSKLDYTRKNEFHAINKYEQYIYHQPRTKFVKDYEFNNKGSNTKCIKARDIIIIELHVYNDNANVIFYKNNVLKFKTQVSSHAHFRLFASFGHTNSCLNISILGYEEYKIK